MCGICGIYFPDHGQVSRPVLEKMTAVLHHRGPDDIGHYIESSKIGLGHRRLSIIDLSQGQQPLANEDGSMQIVFNGEIYNFHEHRETLLKKGHKFKTNCDTEIIIHLYEEYGYDCLTHLRGMFAFAIWDKRQDLVFIARDRLGQKPLVYYSDSKKFLFASEIKSLLQHPELTANPDLVSLHHYLTYQYVPAPTTAFAGIKKLPPAHWLVNQRGKITIQRYWEPDFSKKCRLSAADAAVELRERLTEAVKLRLIADVPLGAFLSGGIDSSVIVGLMSSLVSKPVKTFSIGFDEKEFDELPYARLISERFGTDHHEFIVKPDALAVIDKLVGHFDEPFADPSSINTYYVSAMTRKHVTVALSGDGGDEAFAGYNRYLYFRHLARVARIPGTRLLSGALQGCVSATGEGNHFLDRARRIADLVRKNPIEQYMQLVGHFSDSRKRSLYTDHFSAAVKGNHSSDILGESFARFPNNDIIDQALYVDMMNYLPGDILAKVDITSMANSLECRAPFLDHKVIEFAASLPLEFKLRGRTKKFLLRQACNDLIPDIIQKRSKMGFGLPLAIWFRNELKEFASDTLLSAKARQRGLFKPKAVTQLLQRHFSNQEDNSYRIWNLMMLELWFGRFIDTPDSSV